MLPQIVSYAIAPSDHDTAVRAGAQIAAQCGYVAMCLSLSWGVLVATGWVDRFARRPAMLRGHLVLAGFAIVLGAVHAALFLLLSDPGRRFSPAMITIPFFGGNPARWALGIAGLELLIAIAVSTALRPLLNYLGWLRFHWLAYPAVACGIAHSWLGAAVNGQLAMLWLGGLSVLTPTALIAILRFVPAKYLTFVGLV